jgi:hypothetical protein
MVSLEGRLVPRFRSRFLRLLAALSGLLVLKSLARFVGGYLMGYRRPCIVRITDSGLVLDVRTYLAGKLVRETAMHVPPWKLERVDREERFRYAHVLVGALFFLLGVGLGFGLIVEWAWTRAGVYLLLGLGAMALGIALDAAVVFLVPAARKRSALVIVTRTRRFRIEDVDVTSATRFLEALEEWFTKTRPVKEPAPARPAKE